MRVYRGLQRAVRYLIAAKRSGITNVLIPKENLGDTEEIEANVLKNLNIIPVENIEEVLAEALI